MSETILSVIIVTYCSEDEIVNCIDSIPAKIRNRSVEIIIADNASPDSTLARIYSTERVKKVVASKENLGFSKANNLCYELAEGEYILFLNPDTEISNQVLEHCISRLEADPKIGVISPKLIMRDGEMDLACRRSIPNLWDGFCRALGLSRRFPKSKLFSGYNLTYLPENETYEVGSVNGAFMLSRRKSLLHVGVFDENFFMYGEDLDLCYRFNRAGFRIVYDGRVSAIHLKGMSSSKNSLKMTEQLFACTKQFYLKHFNPWNSKLVNWKYEFLFSVWKGLALARARKTKQNKARPM